MDPREGVDRWRNMTNLVSSRASAPLNWGATARLYRHTSGDRMMDSILTLPFEPGTKLWGFQRGRVSPLIKGGVKFPPAKWLRLIGLVDDYAVAHGADLRHVASGSLDNSSLCFRCHAAIEIGDMVDNRNADT